MKRMLIGIAAVTSLFATSAFAADLPMRTYTKAPAYVEPVYNWTGFYIGGNVGGARSRTDVTSTLLPGAALPGTGAIFGAANSDAVSKRGGQFKCHRLSSFLCGQDTRGRSYPCHSRWRTRMVLPNGVE